MTPLKLVKYAGDDGRLLDVVCGVHQLHVFGGFTCRALDFFVAFVTDQQNVVVVFGEPVDLFVHLGHQWAGRVDRAEVALGRLGVHGR